MAKTIGHLAAIISANVTAFNAGLDKAEARSRTFAVRTTAALNSGGAGGFSAEISAAVRKSVDDLDFVNQQVEHLAKGVQYNGNSIGANFASASNRINASASSSVTQLQSLNKAFALMGRTAAVAGVAMGSFRLGREIREFATFDANMAGHDFANSITGSVDDRIKAITERVKELQPILAGTSIDRIVDGTTLARMQEEMKVYEQELQTLYVQRDRLQGDAENAAAWEKYDEDMARYREHLNKKEALHRQIVDQIDAASVSAEQNKFKRLALQRDIEIKQLEKQFANTGFDKELDQLVGLVMKKYESDRDELLKSKTSDISDMMGEDIEEAVKKMEPARNVAVAAASRPGNNELLRATGANILQSTSASLVSTLEKRAAQQLQESKRQTSLLTSISNNTADDDAFNG